MKKNRSLEQENASVLAEIVVDEDTPDNSRIEALNKLLEGKRAQSFFSAMFSDRLDVAKCPHCELETHWLIPENELNKMGYVTAEHDSRVKPVTTVEDCEQYREACNKKKISF